MIDEHWDQFTTILSKLFKVDKHIIDLIAVQEVLILIASGYSNKSVSRRLEMEEDYVSEVCQEFLKFPGYEEDLDINPYFAFRRSVSFDDFVFEIKLLTKVLDKDCIVWYNVSEEYDKIRKEVDSFYETS